MAKQRPSLEDMAKKEIAALDAANVVPLHGQADVASTTKADRSPHTSLYISKKVQRLIKEIALQYDRKPHDIYLEGIDMVLAHYGRPSISKIDGEK